MKPERLQEINQRVEYLSKAGRLNYTGLFASYCKELIAAVEELQAENKQMRSKLKKIKDDSDAWAELIGQPYG